MCIYPNRHGYLRVDEADCSFGPDILLVAGSRCSVEAQNCIMRVCGCKTEHVLRGCKVARK